MRPLPGSRAKGLLQKFGAGQNSSKEMYSFSGEERRGTYFTFPYSACEVYLTIIEVLDAPGALHHVIARGNERRRIFEDTKDRKEFLARLGEILLGHRNDLLRMGACPQPLLMWSST